MLPAVGCPTSVGVARLEGATLSDIVRLSRVLEMLGALVDCGALVLVLLLLTTDGVGDPLRGGR